MIDYDRIKVIKGMLEKTEMFRSDLMSELNELQENRDTFTPISVYPMANIEHFTFESMPVYQFSYHGALPPYEGMTRQYIKMIRNYYHNTTASSFSNLEVKKLKNVDISGGERKTVILFAHFFNDLATRDLDNRNKKYVLDAIKNTEVINDDSWKDVKLLDSGYLDKGYNHLQVFVFSEKILSTFLEDLENNQEKYIKNKRFKKQFEQFESDYKNNK